MFDLGIFLTIGFIVSVMFTLIRKEDINTFIGRLFVTELFQVIFWLFLTGFKNK